ncbi:TPA: glycosyltransferase [Vibrio diabolicus]
MKIFYVLSRKDFFELGKNGRVAHAAGIVDGLVENNVSVTVFSSVSARNYCSEKASFYKLSGFGVFWYLDLIASLLKNKKHADFIIVRYSTLMGWLYCLILNAFAKNKWGFELNGLGYHQLNGKRGNLTNILRYFERFVISKTPFINCVSENIKNEISKINGSVYVLPNAGYEVEEQDCIDNDYSDVDKLKIIYLGMFHDYYDFDPLVKSISERNDVSLYLYGSGKQYDYLKNESLSVDNIHLMGRYDLEDIVKSGKLDGRTALVLPYKEGTVADYGSPTKLFEYLSLALPIMSTKVSQPYDILKDIAETIPNTVFFYDSSNINEILDAVVHTDLRVDREKLKNKYMNEHTWKSRCSDYLKMIRKHLSK